MHYELEILKSYSIQYPMLAAWGLTLSKPIGLVIRDREHAQKFINQLSPSPLIVDIADKPCKIERSLHLLNSEAFVLDCREILDLKSKNVQENLAYAFRISKGYGRLDYGTVVATFLLFQDFIPKPLKDKLFEIHIEGNQQEALFINNEEWLIPADDEIPEVHRWLKKVVIKEGIHPLSASVEFLKPMLATLGEEKAYKALKGKATEMIEAAEDYCSSDEIAEFIVSEMLDYFEREKLKVYELPTLPDNIDFESSAFFTQNYLFLSDDLLRKICKATNLSSTEIKFVLLENGFLEGNYGDYTSKMNFKVGTKNYRKRMLRLNLNGLTVLKNYCIMES